MIMLDNWIQKEHKRWKLSIGRIDQAHSGLFVALPGKRARIVGRRYDGKSDYVASSRRTVPVPNF